MYGGKKRESKGSRSERERKGRVRKTAGNKGKEGKESEVYGCSCKESDANEEKIGKEKGK